MRDKDNILEVLALKPDFMGFIFYKGTPRFVGEHFALPENIPSTTKRVGVFVNESTVAILKKVQEHRLDLVQLHGNETVNQCRELKELGVSIIKVFPVDDDMDFDLTIPFREAADFFLFDTKGKYFGGNARRFNWEILSRYDQKVPFLLSGGIAPENVDQIRHLADLNLLAIDVNSGVEISPAYKDVNKIKAIKAVLNTKPITP